MAIFFKPRKTDQDIVDLFKQDASNKIKDLFDGATVQDKNHLIRHAIQWGAIDTFKMLATFPKQTISATKYLAELCNIINETYCFAVDKMPGCYLIKTTNNPAKMTLTESIESTKGRQAIFLFNNELYFTKDNECHKIEKSPDNEANYDLLISKFSDSPKLADKDELQLITFITEAKLTRKVKSYRLSQDYFLTHLDKYNELVDFLFINGANPSLGRPAKTCDKTSYKLGFGYSWESDSWISIGEFCTNYIDQIDQPKVKALLQKINGEALQSPSQQFK